MEFHRGDRVRLVAGQSAKGVNDGPGTVAHFGGDPPDSDAPDGYQCSEENVWVEYDNGYKVWEPVAYLVKIVERNDSVALIRDYERVKKGATGVVTHLDGDPCEYPGGAPYRSPPGAVWVDFGANGGRLWVDVEYLEKL